MTERLKRKCSSCDNMLGASNNTRVCSEDCFYNSIYYGNEHECGVLNNPDTPDHVYHVGKRGYRVEKKTMVVKRMDCSDIKKVLDKPNERVFTDILPKGNPVEVIDCLHPTSHKYTGGRFAVRFSNDVENPPEPEGFGWVKILLNNCMTGYYRELCGGEDNGTT